MLFRKAFAQFGKGEPYQLGRRQEDSSTVSASPASTAASAAAATTDKPDTTSITSGASSSAAAAASTSASPTENHDHTVTVTFSTPQFTATKTTAYIAPGVNATDTKTGTSVYSAESYLATANATAPGIPENELTECNINGTSPDNGPFCSPIHLQNLWVGYTYAITWNSGLSTNNASDAVIIRYDDGAPDEVWNSSIVQQGIGYANLYMDKAWLKGQPGNDSTSGQNMTLYMQWDPENNPQNVTKGPTISLVVNPATLPRIPIPKLPSRLGLEIGLPVGLVAALFIIVALWCSMKRTDRSWRDVRGHGKEYMARRARRRGRAAKEGAIQLEDYKSPQSHEAFSDEPYVGGSGNAFRDEIAKQRAEDDRYRPTVHSY
ncbi:hypothetical protein ACLMJK_009636 [Lecanora helva]